MIKISRSWIHLIKGSLWGVSSLDRTNWADWMNSLTTDENVFNHTHLLLLLLPPFPMCLTEIKVLQLTAFLFVSSSGTWCNPERRLYIRLTVLLLQVLHTHAAHLLLYLITLMQFFFLLFCVRVCVCVCVETSRCAGGCGGATESVDKGREQTRRRPTGLCLLSNYASPVSHGSEKWPRVLLGLS